MWLGLLLVVQPAWGGDRARGLNEKQRLGRALFFDRNLSNPVGQACASCHSPPAGFSYPEHDEPIAEGAVAGRFGPRNAPSIAYSAFCPPLSYDAVNDTYVGGLFWDGRADSLADQAAFPIANQLEMHNADRNKVVEAIRKSTYAALFERVYGDGVLGRRRLGGPDAVFKLAMDAIAAYEASPQLASFTSKYDFYLRGKANLTAKESLGLRLFNGKANCFACHPSRVQGDEPGPLFTDFTYDNIGIPKNWESPYLHLSRKLNPDGKHFVDVGLAGTLATVDPVRAADNVGRFKVSTLRNVAVSGPYGHNGYFKTLKEVVDFYNARDVPGAGWPEAEVPDTVNHDELGNLGLTEEEVDAVVAFLGTLTDGWRGR